MKNAVLIHGTTDNDEYYSDTYPSLSNSHWFPWLQKQMLMADILTQTPEMPKATYPDYALWKETLERFPINNESILVGHSCGGGFLLRYFSENKISVKRIVLVAPWLDANHEKDPEFFNFQIDGDLASRTDLHMFYTDNDSESVTKSVAIIHQEIPNIQSREFKNYGHFCLSDMGTEEFPELRYIILNS